MLPTVLSTQIANKDLVWFVKVVAPNPGPQAPPSCMYHSFFFMND